MVRSALQLNALVPVGLALALLLWWGFARTRIGLLVRMAGDSAQATRALGYSVSGLRIAATTAGGFIAGLGGASLTLFYPGSWNEGISSGQGLIAVALVIFARWSPLRCVGAAFLFGGAGAIGPRAAVDRHRLGLPPLQHRALRAHAGDPGADLPPRQRGRGQPRRAVGHQELSFDMTTEPITQGQRP